MFLILHIAARLAGSNVFERLAIVEFAVLVTLIGVFFGFVVSGPMIVLGGPVVLIVLAEAASRIRRRRAGAILSHLDQAIRMNLPLPAMLYAASDTERGTTGRRLDALAWQLEQGGTLSDAIRETVPEIDDRAIRMISVGEWAGRLESVTTHLVNRYSPVTDEHGQRRFEWVYVGIVLMMIASTVALVTVLVVPKFNEIFKDFGTDLPAATQFMVGLTDFMTRDTPIAVILISTLVVIYGVVIIAAIESCALGRVSWGAPFRAIASSLGSRVPWLGTMPRDRALAQACFVLAEAARSGLRLDSAIDEAAHLKMPNIWRTRIAAFGDGVRHGLEPGEAARAAHLPPIVSGMLGPAARGGDTAGAFDFLARYFDQRFSRAAALVRGAMVPATVLTLGFVVGLTVLAMIMPLVALIDGVIANSGY